MNKIGLHFGYLRGTPYESDVLSAMEAVRKTGCELLEIPVSYIFPMDAAKRREVAQCAKDLDLALTMTGSMNGETDIASDDAAIREAGVEFAKRTLQACYDIGATAWGGVNYQAWLGRPQYDLTPDAKERIRQQSLEAMREILPTAEDLGVDYCMELVNRFEGFLLNTAEEGLRYVLDADSPRAMVLLDTYHMNIEEDSILDAMDLVQNEGKLGHFHVGESNRRIPGTGRTHMDWDGIFANLRAHGYMGHILMEPFVRMDLPSSKNTCTWRNLTKNESVEEYMADVTTGYNFIRAGLMKQK